MLEATRSLLKDIQDRKFITVNEKRTTTSQNVCLIKADKRYQQADEFLKTKYVDEGYGVVGLIKEFNLPITYPVLRSILLKDVFSFKLRRGNNVVTDRVRKLRSARAYTQARNIASEFGKPQRTTATDRGVQGFYTAKNGERVWLRSTYEYIYAKWLDKQGIRWKLEVDRYLLPNGKLYTPDFFIYDTQGNLSAIVEVKGYWRNRAYKAKMLENMLGLKVVLITDITKYTDKTYSQEYREWKRLRKLE